MKVNRRNRGLTRNHRNPYHRNQNRSRRNLSYPAQTDQHQSQTTRRCRLNSH